MYKPKVSTLTILAVIVLVFSFAFQQPAAAEAPANDTVALAIPISSLPFTDEIDTTGATTDASDFPSCGKDPAYTVWYQLTPTGNMTVQIETGQSSYHPQTTIYEGAPASGTNIYCTFSPTFQVSLTANTTYYIRFSSYGGLPYGDPNHTPAGGMLRLTMEKLMGPVHDNFVDAKEVVLDINQGYSDVFDNHYATTEAGEPTPGCGTPYRTAWYKFTPASNGRATANYYDSYSKFIAVYTGDGLGNLSLLSNSCFWYTRDFVVKAGTTYYIQLGELYSWSYSQGNFSLAFMPAPANDEQANAIAISGLPFDFFPDMTAATSNPGDPSNGCGIQAGKTLWYLFAPAADMDIEMTYLSGWDSSLTLFRYSAEGGLAYMNCVYPYSTVAQTRLVLGDTYYLMISAPEYVTGTAQFRISQIFRPPNDNFAEALIVTTLPYEGSTPITYASSEPDDPGSCGWWWPRKTVWYKFTPDRDMVVDWYMWGSLETDISIFKYEGDQLISLRCVYNYTSEYTRVTGGVPYYFMISTPSYIQGEVGLRIQEVPKPANDNFVDTQIITIPFSYGLEISAATVEPGEPVPSCFGEQRYESVWFAFTPHKDNFIHAQVTGWWDMPFMAIYQGASLDGLTELACRTYSDRIVMPVNAGQTYTIQLGSAYDVRNWVTFFVEWAPPPVAGFGFWPGDSNIFDTVYFWDGSYDPLGMPITSFEWDFGDGTQAEGYNPSHQYAADGDYTVWHRVMTEDGRQAETTQTIQVRTHEVAITKFTVPQSASLNMTRPITVGIRNTRYPETVVVDLYKSTPNGWEWVGSLRQYVPIRAGNRTTDFIFKYTFTKADVAMGKVTFKAEAWIENLRDALPGDNTAISLPTKVGR